MTTSFTSDTAVPSADVFTTYVEEYFDPSDMTTTAGIRTTSKKAKIVWAVTGVLLACILFLGIFFITTSVIKHKKAASDLKGVTPMLPAGSGAGLLSPEAVSMLDGLKARADILQAKKNQGIPFDRRLNWVQAALTHLRVVGETATPWFSDWAFVANTLLLQLETDGKKTKLTAELAKDFKFRHEKMEAMMEDLKALYAGKDANDIQNMENSSLLEANRWEKFAVANKKLIGEEAKKPKKKLSVKLKKFAWEEIPQGTLDSCLLNVLRGACEWKLGNN